MRKLTTVLCCMLLLSYGIILGYNNKSNSLTAIAAQQQPPPITLVKGELPYDLLQDLKKIDTIYIYKDSCTSEHKKKIKNKVVRIPYAVRDTLYVPVVFVLPDWDRKDEPKDKSTTVSADTIDVVAADTISIP